MPGLRFVALQRELRDADATVLKQFPDIMALGDKLHSFDDNAAVIAAVDLVITIDTAIAHLAGALGKPTWLLLKFGAGLALADRARRQPLVPHRKAVQAADARRLGKRHPAGASRADCALPGCGALRTVILSRRRTRAMASARPYRRYGIVVARDD